MTSYDFLSIIPSWNRPLSLYVHMLSIAQPWLGTGSWGIKKLSFRFHIPWTVKHSSHTEFIPVNSSSSLVFVYFDLDHSHQSPSFACGPFASGFDVIPAQHRTIFVHLPFVPGRSQKQVRVICCGLKSLEYKLRGKFAEMEGNDTISRFAQTLGLPCSDQMEGHRGQHGLVSANWPSFIGDGWLCVWHGIGNITTTPTTHTGQLPMVLSSSITQHHPLSWEVYSFFAV